MTSDDQRPPSGSTGDGPPASVDELASALLDDALTADQAREARSRPGVAMRAAEMAAVRETLRAATPAPDPLARERAVASALAAFDDADATAPTAGTAASAPGSAPAAPTRSPGADDTGDELGARRAAARDRATRRSAPRWLGAAAAALVLAGAAGVAVLSSSGSEDETANSAGDDGAVASQPESAEDLSDASGDADGEAPSAGADAERDEAAEAEASEFADATIEVGDLGTFSSIDDLVARLDVLIGSADPTDPAADDPAAVAPQTGTSADALEQLRTACPVGLPGSLDDPAVSRRLHARAVVEGIDIDVWVIDTPEGSRVVAVDAGCALVADRPLD